MAQFIAYKNTNHATKEIYPYLLDIQTNLLDDLRTTIVIPLCPISMASGTKMAKLCPIVEIDNAEYIVLAAQISGVDRHILGQKISNLSAYRDEIISAIDFIVSGI